MCSRAVLPEVSGIKDVPDVGWCSTKSFYTTIYHISSGNNIIYPRLDFETTQNAWILLEVKKKNS